MAEMLCETLNYMRRKDVWPEEWREGVVESLYTDGNKSDLDNYRGITLLPCLSKTFQTILNMKQQKWVKGLPLSAVIARGIRDEREEAKRCPL